MKSVDMRNLIAGGSIALIVGVATLPDPSWAAPPPHAPAHGWRKQHDPYYLGYTGKRWEKDYGILSGRCDRAGVGAVLGATVGGVIGSQVGSGDSRVIAVIAGTVLGAVVGAELGKRMDDADRACLAHGLELAADGQRVRWDAPESGLSYALVPQGAYRRDSNCREFTLEVAGTHRGSSRGVGCRRADGSWELRAL